MANEDATGIEVPLSILEEMSGFSRRMLMKARAGKTRPHRKNRDRLTSIVKELELA